MSNATASAPTPVPVDLYVPENYIEHTLKTTEPLPPLTWKTLRHEIMWDSVLALGVTPIVGVVGAITTELQWRTALWSVAYYFITGLGITAGYHRLWAHRSYNAHWILEYGLMLAATGSIQGSVKWWSRGHRAHHRYTDTDLDPYNAERGFFYSHIGWMLVKPRRANGMADVSDLSKRDVVKWQYRNYIPMILFMGFIFPTLVAWLGWGDARGGFFFAGVWRLVFVHHSTFCVNSLAHWLGESPFDDKHTPKNHLITAFATIGEGYHNFHHQFPTDYRNAIRWYQYDPTKWFIYCMFKLGLAWQLKTFPSNEIEKGVLTMELKRLRKKQDTLDWPAHSNDLPVVSFESFQSQAKKRPIVLISGFLHDMTDFIDEHPGGAHLIKRFIGKDATTAFFGGIYEHSNAAHNLLAMKRVGILDGGYPHILDIAKSVPPSQRLWIAQHPELSHMWEDVTSSSSTGSLNSRTGSTTAWSDDEDSGSPLKKKGL